MRRLLPPSIFEQRYSLQPMLVSGFNDICVVLGTVWKPDRFYINGQEDIRMSCRVRPTDTSRAGNLFAGDE